MTYDIGGFLDFSSGTLSTLDFHGFFSLAFSGDALLYFIIFAGILCNAPVTR